MSVITRSEYGFPFERGDTSTDVFLIVRTADAMHHIICCIPQTKLERAQAIAAEVRARKFPPVKRIQLENEE